MSGCDALNAQVAGWVVGVRSGDVFFEIGHGIAVRVQCGVAWHGRIETIGRFPYIGYAVPVRVRQHDDVHQHAMAHTDGGRRSALDHEAVSVGAGIGGSSKSIERAVAGSNICVNGGGSESPLIRERRWVSGIGGAEGDYSAC